MRQKDKSPVYSRDVMELVTVAVEYCAFLEQTEGKARMDFVDTMMKLLPLLYLKAVLLPKYEILDNGYFPEDFVTEENYNIVRANINIIMGEKDDYLDVFMEDMKYSESPILTTISENLADIYQELKNFVMAYKNATDEELMMNALAEIKEEFQFSWGQKLVNVQRALHEVRYSEEEDY
ncbi:MAG: DUF5063 domain-containing protein [Bacteroidaceae bacterium]|nr:DUF5063 domain-containing protein [Bacteroidaceae bacterium]